MDKDTNLQDMEERVQTLTERLFVAERDETGGKHTTRAKWESC